MNIYMDESGSINNHVPGNRYFVIAMVRVLDKAALKRAYKRFVSSNYTRLLELDQEKVNENTGKVIKAGGRMFTHNKFKELKGAQFDRDMKRRFVAFFSQKRTFELYYIKIANEKLTDYFCQNTARVFNYTVRLALDYFLRNGYLPQEDCCLQLDERNEKTETRYFLENYLNTELTMNGVTTGKFDVIYFDSANNDLIQLADVFSNLYYSHLQTGSYEDAFKKLGESGILRFVFEFPK